MNQTNNQPYLVKALKENWRREMQAVRLYQTAADMERDDRRRDILTRLADVERKHAKMWESKLEDLGEDVEAMRANAPKSAATDAENTPQTKLLQEIEAIENGNAAWYHSQRNVIGDDPEIERIIDEIDQDEADHDSVVSQLARRSPESASKRLHGIWGQERHRNTGSGWVGDAVYGVNDGLGAIFGIIAGVAGFTAKDSTVLMSGLFGVFASTLSMGAGAWLATKSENELMESQLAQEKREVEEDPEHEAEELTLLYELKGFSTSESKEISDRIKSDPDLMLKTMAQEELGISEMNTGSPWRSAGVGSASTLIGGLIPVVPFFFMHGPQAIIAAAAVSIVAHFAVGAAKSLITVRSWWASGFEMTLVGVIVGGASYAVGFFGSTMFHGHL